MAFVLVPLTFVESLPSSTAHYMVSKFTPLLFVGKVLHACPSMQRCLWKSLSMASVLVPLKIVSSSTSNTAQLHGIQFATANFCGKKVRRAFPSVQRRVWKPDRIRFGTTRSCGGTLRHLFCYLSGIFSDVLSDILCRIWSDPFVP